MGTGVTYSFTTSLGDILTRVPLGAWYVDLVKMLGAGAAPSPSIANRYPPPPIPAYIETLLAEPYALLPGLQLVVGSSTSAELESPNAETYNLSDGATLKVRIDDGYIQTITLSGLTSGAATAEEVAKSIHLQIRKARVILDSSETKVTIVSKTQGSESSVFVYGGTAAAALGYDTNPATGTAYGLDGEETVTFTANRAETKTVSTAPFNMTGVPLTLDVSIDGGVPQTITFEAADFLDTANATAREIAAVLNDQLNFGSAAVTDNGSTVTIYSVIYGTSATVQVTGGTANAVLGFPVTVQNGSGDFANLALAGSAEVRDYLNANLTRVSTVLNDLGNGVRLTTGYEKLSCSGDAGRALGLSTTGSALTTNSEPFELADGQTIKIQIDGGDIQTIRLEESGLEELDSSSAETVAAIFNRQLKGATASISADAQRVLVSSNSEGASSSVQILGGSANPILGFPTDLQAGIDPGQTTFAEGLHDEPIEFEVFDITSSGFDWVKVWVTTDFGKTLVWDSAVGPASGWSVTESKWQSPGSGVDDVWSVKLEHTESFLSDEVVVVQVQARTLLPETLDETYLFFAEDTRRPSITKVTVRTPRTLRLQFTEPMLQTGSDGTSALYARDVSGRVSYHASVNINGTDYTNVIHAPTAVFLTSDVDLFIGSVGAKNASNNGVFKVLSRISGEYVKVDRNLVDEEAADPKTENVPSLYVSSYRVVPSTPAEGVVRPAFQPAVSDAEAVDSSSIPTGDEPLRYVDLTLHDDLTPSIDYDLEVLRIEDPAGNEIASTYPFTSWIPRYIDGRSFDLWDMIPQKNKDEDLTQDLEKFIRCLDEVTKVMLNDVDWFGDILDPWAMKEVAVDAMLGSLGNPFDFVSSLPVDKRRSLAAVLVLMYKDKGTEEGIEDAVSFFVGKTVNVEPWNIPSDTWELGVSRLGLDTFVGPSRSYIRYAFYVEHADVLTDDEKDLIEQIVDFMRPAHTHFVGFVKI